MNTQAQATAIPALLDSIAMASDGAKAMKGRNHDDKIEQEQARREGGLKLQDSFLKTHVSLKDPAGHDSSTVTQKTVPMF